MRQGGDALHFNRVAVLERVIQDTGGIDNLPAQVPVVHVAHKQGFRGKGIRLNIDLGAGELVHEAGFAHVGVPANEQRAGVGVDSRETSHVLADLFQVRERVLLALEDGDHATQGSALELLAAVQRVAEFEQTGIVFSDILDQVFCGRELGQGEFVVVSVVEHVEQVRVERVDFL